MKGIKHIIEAAAISVCLFFIEITSRKIKQLEKSEQKFFNMYKTVYQWINVKQDEESFENFFKEHGYYKVAIYGMSDLGNLLLREFQKAEGVKIIYGIDKNAEAIISEIPVIKPENVGNEPDVIVVTVLQAFESIKRELTKYTNTKIISIEEVVYNL